MCKLERSLRLLQAYILYLDIDILRDKWGSFRTALEYVLQMNARLI